MVYVMSDIHGNMNRFQSVMRQIKLTDKDKLYVLGDVIDRYPDGIRILWKLMKMPNVQMLLGNHEHMMLAALKGYNPEDADELWNHKKRIRDWYHNNGMVTHKSFNHYSKADRAEIIRYLRKLPLNLDIEVGGVKYRLVHGAPVEWYDKYKIRYEDEAEFAVWHRIEASCPDLEDAILIMGHTPTEYYQKDDPLRIWYSLSGKRIGIDCGCGYPRVYTHYKLGRKVGRLLCLRLDDMKEFYSENDSTDELLPEWEAIE